MTHYFPKGTSSRGVQSTMDLLVKGKEMVYRMIYIDAWVSHVGIQTRATRNLKIHTAKMRRMTWFDIIDFLDKVESPKKAKRLNLKNAKEVSDLYETIVAETNDVFRDIAASKRMRVDESRVRKQASEFLAEADAYAKKHSDS
jgi:hypothetical protein